MGNIKPCCYPNCPEDRLGINKYCSFHGTVTRAAWRYKISKDEVIELLSKDQCDLCGKEFINVAEKQIDHDHSNGNVRGVLCRTCNTGLGKFKDNVEMLLEAIKYLNHGSKS